MIFPRIRVGKFVKPWPMGGKKPCVIFHCFIQPPSLKTIALSWGSYGWEWSVAGLSVLAHTHTPPADWTSQWAEEWLRPSFHSHYHAFFSIVGSSSRIGELFIFMQGRDSCSFSRTGFSWFRLTQWAGSRALSSMIFRWRVLRREIPMAWGTTTDS